MRLKKLVEQLIPNQLVRMRLRVKTGVLSESHTVYEALRRYPPDPEPMPRELKELKLPWDDLEDAYRAKEKAEGMETAVPVNDPRGDPATEFAQRQWRRMNREGLGEKEAFELVKAEYQRERKEAIVKIQDIRKSFRQWHRGEREAPMTAQHFKVWSALCRQLEEKPWGKRNTAERVDIDSWLAAAILGWRWRLERIYDEEASYLESWGLPKDKKYDPERVALALEMAKLRRDAFYPVLHDDLAMDDEEEDDKDPPLNPRAVVVEYDIDDEPREFMIDKDFDALQYRAEERPITEWTKAEVAEMDAYLATCFTEKKLIIIDPSGETKIDNSLPIERLRLEVFPELCPTYTNRPSKKTSALADILNASRDKEETNPDLFDASEHPKFDQRGKRVLLVRTTKDPKKIPYALARAGIFPEVNLDDILEMADNATSEDDKTPQLVQVIKALKDPNSYESRMIRAARKSFRDERFLDRINAKKDKRPEDTWILDDDNNRIKLPPNFYDADDHQE